MLCCFMGGIQCTLYFSPQYTAALYNFKTCTLLWMYYKIPTFFLLLALLCDLYCFIPKWLIVLIWGNVLSWEKPRRKWRGGEAFFLEGIQLSCLWAQGYWKADSKAYLAPLRLHHPIPPPPFMPLTWSKAIQASLIPWKLYQHSYQLLISCRLKRCTMWELQVLSRAKWGLQSRETTSESSWETAQRGHERKSIYKDFGEMEFNCRSQTRTLQGFLQGLMSHEGI